MHKHLIAAYTAPIIMATMEDYIDLTNPDVNLENYRIEADGFNCALRDDNKHYKGFLLAKSEHGNAYTICNVDFQLSRTNGKYPPRLMFRRTDANLQDKAVRKNMDYATVTFQSGKDGYREFWQMVAFLSKFKELGDLSEFFGKYQVVSKDSVVVSLKQRKVHERMQEIAKYVEESGLSDADMAELLAVKARKQDVEEFRKLLCDENGYRAAYRAAHKAEIKGRGGEAIWHHFLKAHQWIFGLSLDLRFIEDFLDEQSVGIPNTERQGDPKADMLGYSDYTVLVELKTPDTDIFTVERTSNARTNTWSFTPEFIEGFSQCLAQKTDWEKASPHRDMVKDGERLDRGIIRTIDPQVIFIVGDKEREIPRNSRQVAVELKRDTLERFIRNNRNVNIISYDELYRRAYQIAHGETPPEPVVDAEDDEPIDMDAIPF